MKQQLLVQDDWRESMHSQCKEPNWTGISSNGTFGAQHLRVCHSDIWTFGKEEADAK